MTLLHVIQKVKDPYWELTPGRFGGLLRQRTYAELSAQHLLIGMWPLSWHRPNITTVSGLWWWAKRKGGSND